MVKKRKAQSALRRATETDDIVAAKQAIKQLHENGSDILAPDRRGCTTLHYAVEAAAIGITQLLLESRADANARDINNAPPLDAAVYYEFKCQSKHKRARYEAVRELLEKHGGQGSKSGERNDNEHYEKHLQHAWNAAWARSRSPPSRSRTPSEPCEDAHPVIEIDTGTKQEAMCSHDDAGVPVVKVDDSDDDHVQASHVSTSSSNSQKNARLPAKRASSEMQERLQRAQLARDSAEKLLNEVLEQNRLMAEKLEQTEEKLEEKECTNGHLEKCLADATSHAAELESSLNLVRSDVASFAGTENGVEWQYWSEGWCSVSLDASEQLHKAYMAYLSKCAQQRSFHVSSGGKCYIVDFQEMSQANQMTGTRRDIRVTCKVPSSWSTPPRDLLWQQKSEAMYVLVHDEDVTKSITNLLRASAHLPSRGHAGSRCSVMRDAQISKIFRIENFLLWRKYSDCLRHMESRELQDEMCIGSHKIHPLLGVNSESLQAEVTALSRPFRFREAVNENWAFHGSTYGNIGDIVEHGFDHRVAKSSGFYGLGTYFTSQSCKAHQYTCGNCGPNRACRCRHARWMILARVALGCPFYIQKVSRGLRRPPPRNEGSNLHNSVIANPGPMAEHHRGHQDHQEFVVFDGGQAYPCYVFEYTS